VDIKNFTYNEISFLAFGEAQRVKAQIDALIVENDNLTDTVEELSKSLVGVKE